MDSSEYSAGGNSANQQNPKPPLKIKIYGPSPSPLTGSPSYKRRLLQTAPLIYDSSTSPLRVEEDTHKMKKQRTHPSSGIGKHHPPYPTSEVWRLEGIHENSLEALRLAEFKIHTVKDLRQSIAMNPDALRQILGRWLSEKVLDTVVSHAMQCVLDEAEYYIFHAQDQGAFLLFNSVYELTKVSLDGVTSLNSDQLSSNQKALLEDLKRQAYENINDFVAVDRWAFPDHSPEPLSCPQDAGCSNEFVDEGPGSPGFLSESFFLGFDVFFMYRRGDIRSEFISHLRAALCRRGICVYDENFDEVPTQVQSEITVPKCKVLIIFLTRNYVSSNLADIIEQRRTKDHVVFPIFYGLTPSDLISKIESYMRFFLCEKTKMWWAALKELAQMPGYILADKTESELIDEIVIYISQVLCSSDKMSNMIGMDVQVEEVLSLLCIESPDVRCLGIWGMVGIGKTTIAEEIFRRISVQYETCVFLKDLHEEIELKGHDAVKEEFLSRVLEIEPHVLRISGIKTSFLRSRLQRKRVLVILDDVNDYRDVETFWGKLNYCGPGSRLIMTSRNRRVFVLCKIDHVYEVKPLDIPKSLLLLDHGKFQIVLSPEVYKTLSLELVKFSNGNPQVLQFLSNADREWNRLLQEVKTAAPIYIPGIFQRSCCGLDDNERSIFLDIACFFNRMDKDNVAMLLDGCGFSAHVGFKGLVDKSLLTISQHNLVDMLSFIQATGREIVRQESADRPGDRSRLWNAEDIRDVFINDTGTSAIEGIFLDMLNLKFDANPNLFEMMCNLRLLKLYCSKVEEKPGISFPQGLEYLPSKLRLLHWEYYPLSSLPRNFDPKNLVELNLPSSCAKKLWKGKKSLEKLKKMRLSYSYQLTKIPRLSSAPNLELLDLEGCNSLLSISQSISYLKKLVFLNLKDCSMLESIPCMVDLESLEVLNLSGCSKLENFPEISPNVKELYMGGTMIQEIPSSIKNLVLLKKLDLENSRHLRNLPTSICKLKHLETLNLSGCTSLERFPDLSRRMKCLRFLDLSRTAINEPPSSISYLTALEELRFVNCRSHVKFPIVTNPNANFTELMPSESNKVENLGTPADKEVVIGGTVENRCGIERAPTILVKSKSRGYLVPKEDLSSSLMTRSLKHHVFPSFYELDVRKTFLSHILVVFREWGIDTFIDNQIPRGKSIGLDLIEAIRGSKIAIILLSKNYAFSSWCLNELVEIMKCREELGQIVMTIFYEVDPTDIKKQTGDFGKAFRKTCKGKTKENIERWRKALEDVATIAGEHSCNWINEAAMIEKIANDISNMLISSTPSSDFDGLFRMRAHMERIEQLLVDEERMFGIWGPPGIGKTTIAKDLFNQVSNRFQLGAFMVDIKGCYPRPCLDEYSAQLHLQSHLLSEIINQQDIMISHLGVGRSVGFSDQTESDCLGLLESRGSRMVEALVRAKLQDGYVSYPWERRMQEALPISGSSNFLSILFLPKASAYGRAGSRYNDLEDTLARANAWLSCSQANGVPIVFMNIQTESLLTKISGETASATVNTTSLSDLSNLASTSLYEFEDYHGVDIGVVRAVRLWFAPLGVEFPLEIKLKDGDTKLGFSISRTEEGFIYVSSLKDQEDESAPAARSGLSSLYREAAKASRRLVVSRVGNQKVLPWMVSSTGAIRCYDTVSISQKLSLHRHAKVHIGLHVFLWDSSSTTNFSSSPKSSSGGTHLLFSNEMLDSTEFPRRDVEDLEVQARKFSLQRYLEKRKDRRFSETKKASGVASSSSEMFLNRQPRINAAYSQVPSRQAPEVEV